MESTPNPEVISIVKIFPVSNTIRDIQSFLLLCSYYRRFVEGLSTIAGPLTKLLYKTTRWQWEEEQQEAFQKLKNALTTRPILAFPDLFKGTLHTDASGYGVRAILE